MHVLKMNLPYRRPFSIVCNCGTIIKNLQDLYHGFCSESRTDKSINKIHILKKDDFYCITYKKKTIYTRNPLVQIQSLIDDFSICNKNLISLHGAAAEYKNEAYVFLSASGSGKTTLTAFLLSVGFKLITEDCVLLDPEKDFVFPHALPLRLRKGGFKILKPLMDLTAIGTVKNKEDRIIVIPNKDICVREKLPLKKVFFLQRTLLKDEVIYIPREGRFFWLLHSLMSPESLCSAVAGKIALLAKKPAYLLCYTNLNFVATILKSEGI